MTDACERRMRVRRRVLGIARRTFDALADANGTADRSRVGAADGDAEDDDRGRRARPNGTTRGGPR